MSAAQILTYGVLVAVAAILIGALTDLSIGVVAIFVLAAGVFFAFVAQDSRKGEHRPG
jgi:hypothetical protein